MTVLCRPDHVPGTNIKEGVLLSSATLVGEMTMLTHSGATTARHFDTCSAVRARTDQDGKHLIEPSGEFQAAMWSHYVSIFANTPSLGCQQMVTSITGMRYLEQALGTRDHSPLAFHPPEVQLRLAEVCGFVSPGAVTLDRVGLPLRDKFLFALTDSHGRVCQGVVAPQPQNLNHCDQTSNAHRCADTAAFELSTLALAWQRRGNLTETRVALGEELNALLLRKLDVTNKALSQARYPGQVLGKSAAIYEIVHRRTLRQTVMTLKILCLEIL
jgi:hypothetical protein